MARPTLAALGPLALAAALSLSGCAADSGAQVRQPPTDAGFDYQLGGAYDPPEGVTVVERDRTAEPAGLGYDICYVNGFQTQPEASETFAAEHRELLVTAGGEPLIDPGWPDEFLYDTSTEANRAWIAELVGEEIHDCQAAGYDAVEFDNLDSYLRADGALTEADNVALASTYAQLAHQAGLAVAQKNAVELASQLRDVGFDFAITESCAEFDECADYADAYPVVLDIEYTDELGEAGFAAACEAPDRPTTMILRDPKLVAAGDPDYVFEACPQS
ncbi:endo alpha-1,4 polygalactosaminidase [Gulosibacter sp. ACHW.36C]|uniref:Endo alpha-1,4 polygalactosaminidase n=1 Tax=Gulosibacter sediminis TaxID=1729695 RepID=A0ABY4N322_9MICO|nr:endo alpha-1,4 polygalactosaminidase [Gulosibacter sediminis]UQN15628.1 endo alpha-1,4 polygalactosaminidase [Gulosibacter sediminis]